MTGGREPRRPPYVAVCGPASAAAEDEARAEVVGRLLAEAGAVLVCGGLGGVLDAAARGAAAMGGAVVGILPGSDRLGASPHLTVSIPTGMGELRNGLIVRAADALIAVSGEFGTLSEIALALKRGIPVIGLSTWVLSRDGAAGDPIVRAGSPEAAVAAALSAARPR